MIRLIKWIKINFIFKCSSVTTDNNFWYFFFQFFYYSLFLIYSSNNNNFHNLWEFILVGRCANWFTIFGLIELIILPYNNFPNLYFFIDFNISEILEKTYDLIDEHFAKGEGILVHCYRGFTIRFSNNLLFNDKIWLVIWTSIKPCFM